MIYTNDAITDELNKRKRRRKIFRMIFDPIVALIVLACIIAIFQRLVLKEDVHFFNYKFFLIETGSMTPNINVSDIVIVDTNQKNIQEGDVITFRKNNQAITHRAVEVYEENGNTYIVTKGDYNGSNDSEPVRIENVEGKGVGQFVILGKFIIRTKNPVGIAIIISILGIWYFIEMRRIDRKKARHILREKYEQASKAQAREFENSL